MLISLKILNSIKLERIEIKEKSNKKNKKFKQKVKLLLIRTAVFANEKKGKINGGKASQIIIRKI